MHFKGTSNSSVWVVPALIAIVVVISFFITYSTPVRQLEQKITDQLFEIRGPLALQDTSIIMVSISQQADEAIPYKYPWPTSYYAKLIENLNKAGARAIGLDVIFDNRDTYDPANDSLFAATLKKYKNVVLAGNVVATVDPRGQFGRSISTTLVQSNAVLSNANPNAMGLVKVVKDRYDEVRRQLLHLEYRDSTYYSMALELLRIYNGWEEINLKDRGDYFQFNTYKIPKYDSHTMAINFIGPPRTFYLHSFDTVIDDSTIMLVNEEPGFEFNSFSTPDNGLLVEEVFKDKIVLVGATMPELQDFHATPFSVEGNMPGFEIHANALKTILTGRYIYYPPVWANILMLVPFSIIIVLIIRKTGALWGALVYVTLGVLVGAATIYAFLEYSYILDLTGPFIALTIGYIATNSYEYFTEQQEKQRIHGMFSSYVSPALVDEMIASGQKPQLGGDEVHMTAFFSDIVSFSSFSEKLEAEQLVLLINEYLSAMTKIINDEGGTLDKYIGDAIVAFFGAPVHYENHAWRACRSSQLMQQELAKLRKKWKSEGDRWPKIVQQMRMRIGVNTGLMVTGNMGSERRFNYTMMGDNVNLAARCESGAKSYGVFTMVTGQTKEEAEKEDTHCVFRYLDRIVVKGRTQPVDVYEIMGLEDDLDEQNFECKEHFEKGIDYYKNQDWEQAIACFENSKKLEKNIPSQKSTLIRTNPSLVYLERCPMMKKNPPGADWDGVYVMKTK